MDQKEITVIKEHYNRSKDTFNSLITRQDIAESRISELEAISTECLKTQKQREQGLRKQNSISKYCGTSPQGITCA